MSEQCQSTVNVKTDLFAQIFSDDLLDLLHGAGRSSAVEDLQCARVLLGQEVVQSTEMLPHLNERASVRTAQVSEPLG